MRGNPARLKVPFTFSGSIPACAGEPLALNLAMVRTGVYPRVCGGTDVTLERDNFVTGLSPRVRGNRAENITDALHGGSIPACAGEPSGLGATWSPPWVYPRVCGGTSSL